MCLPLEKIEGEGYPISGMISTMFYGRQISMHQSLYAKLFERYLYMHYYVHYIGREMGEGGPHSQMCILFIPPHFCILRPSIMYCLFFHSLSLSLDNGISSFSDDYFKNSL